MRLQNSIKNMKYNIIAQLLSFLTQFITRTVFINIVGKTYLGVSGLFSNVLTILSLADLGIGTVLIYSLYEPLAKKDTKKIQELIQLYKKVYNSIALIVLIIGLCLAPFIQVIIKTDANIEHVHLIFVLYLINTVISYLCIYKISIINADQKNYIVTIYQQAFNILSNIVMIIVLIITKNFIFYLIAQILFSIISNIVLSKKAEKMYPYIKNTKGCKINEIEKKKIKSNTKAMFLHKIGGVVVSGTDNLLISALISIDMVGIYSNYLLILNAIKKFTTQYFNSIIASVGNLTAEKNVNHLKNVFYNVLFGNFIIFAFCSICLCGLINAFIEVWLGKEYIFNSAIVICIILQFYIEGIRQTTLTFKETMGLFKQDQFKPIIEACINLIVSIILAIKFGIIGIILGTVVSMAFSLIIETEVLFKYGFKENTKYYYVLLFKYMLIVSIAAVIIMILTSIIRFDNQLVELIVKFLIVPVVTLMILIICTFKRKEFEYFKSKMLNIKFFRNGE